MSTAQDFRTRATAQPSSTDAWLGATLTMAILFGFFLADEQFQHWFILPVGLCGVLIAPDAVAWLRGRLDLLDPQGVLAALMMHFFFIAPLLHVLWDYWARYPAPPADWRPWLGQMALLNASGLAIYRTILHRYSGLPAPPRRVWKVQRGRMIALAVPLLMVTAFLQALVYAEHGGIYGYMETYSERSLEDRPFQGLGLLYAISESFPILALFLFIIIARQHPFLRNGLVVLAFLATFLLLQLLFGGLRGSRSATLWALLWAGGCIHLLVRPFSRHSLGFALAFIIFFMYAYGFYKSYGTNAVRALEGAEARARLVEQSGRDLDHILLADMGRADIQALLLFRLQDPAADFSPAWGRTYLGTLALAIPRSLWPDRPHTKIKEGTEIQFGTGVFDRGHFESTRVYGLGGEAMLNFGPAAVPVVYTLFGITVVAFRRTFWIWRIHEDARILIVPLLINGCFVLLANDSDNLLFMITKNGMVPFSIVWLSTIQHARAQSTHTRTPVLSTDHTWIEGGTR